ncbi:MAG: flagellar biosynthetic protein FliR [Lachnospiraceae bacterium]|nr:flagellar biosynthetic protein FliR [Lachnospiraceae bacterium]
MINYSFTVYDLEYFLLILVRVSCFVFICPFFSMNNTPRRVRTALSIFISALIYSSVTPAEAIVTNSLLQYAIIVLSEAIAGLLIGLSVNVCTTVFNFAGGIADMETGLRMVTLMDPATREQVSITGGIFNYAFSMILIASGMYRYLLGALADTYVLIPVGHVTFNMNGIMSTFVTFLGDYLIIGFRIILPIFATMMMLNAILGVMAKVSPQMNMFSVGIQLKVITGLSILFLTVGMMPAASDMIFAEMKKLMVSVVSNLM